jgi:hypothetical protein
MAMRFLDVKTDFAFKKVFGSEQSTAILIDFLNAVLEYKKSGLILFACKRAGYRKPWMIVRKSEEKKRYWPLPNNYWMFWMTLR